MKSTGAVGGQPPDAFDLSRVILRLEDDLAQARAAYKTVCEERNELRDQLGSVYNERARLAAFLAACYPAVRVPDWDDDEYEIVFVATPAGQMSWHVRVDDLEGLFPHVPEEERTEWDGHTTGQKYERLASLTVSVAAVRAVAAIERDPVWDGSDARPSVWDEEAQRSADLRAHVSGTGGPSSAWVTDDAAAVAAEQEREARQHARDMATEDGDLDDCEPTL